MTEELLFVCCDDIMLCRNDDHGLIWHATAFERWVCPRCGRAADLVMFRLDVDQLQDELWFHRRDGTPPPDPYSLDERRCQPDGNRTEETGD